jgi:hypothetical protein
MDGGELDRVVILRMLLEHERRLRKIDGELREVRRRMKAVEELKGEISYWLRLTEKLRKLSQWSEGLESMR